MSTERGSGLTICKRWISHFLISASSTPDAGEQRPSEKASLRVRVPARECVTWCGLLDSTNANVHAERHVCVCVCVVCGEQ